MVIAVTGGSGFIGKNLVKSLQLSGHKVRVLSRKPVYECYNKNNIQHFHGDLTTDSDLSGFLNKVDILFHCAGETLKTEHMIALHIHGTERLARAAAGKINRWVQLSSTGAYGPRRKGIVLETDELKPVGLYETSKARSDELITDLSEQGAFERVILRPSIVFGPEMPNQSLFSMLKTIEKGVFFYIGKPGASANYIHVDNVIKALTMCGLEDKAKGQIFNISDYCTVELFTALMANSLECKPPFLRFPEALIRTTSWCLEPFPHWPLKASRIDALTSFVRYPINKIENSLNYNHDIDMPSAVSSLVRFYKGQPL